MTKFWIALAVCAVPAFAGPAFAQTAEHQGRHQPTAEEKAKWDAMTPDERKAKMDEMRAKREASMTPEQKAQHEARRKAWEAMTPEQREAKRAEMRKNHPRRGNR